MKKTFFKMLKELRLHLTILLLSFSALFVVCYVNKSVIYSIVVAPVLHILQKSLAEVFIYTSIFESFTTDISVCSYVSIFLSLPVFIACLYLFVSKSLFDDERRVFRKLLVCSGVLSVFAVLTTYYFVFPRAVEFFVITQSNVAKPMLRIGDYVSTFFHIIFGFMLIFQLPVVMVGLVRFGVIKPSFLTENRRIAIVVIFIVSAVITPPDVISQVICAGVLMFLYELTNFYIKNSFKKSIKITKRKTNAKKRFTKSNKRLNEGSIIEN